MKKEQKLKFFSVIALVVSIFGMSLGFAAFSTSLNIESGAKVSPGSSDFSVALKPNNEGIQTSRLVGTTNTGGNASIATIYSSSIRGMSGTLWERGHYIKYNFYIYNSGKYNAYLKNVTFNNVDDYEKNIVCSVPTEETGLSSEMLASEELVSQACEGIKVSLSSGDMIVYDTTEFNSSFVLYPGVYFPITFKIELSSDAVLPDGVMSVAIGDISFEFSTAG